MRSTTEDMKQAIQDVLIAKEGAKENNEPIKAQQSQATLPKFLTERQKTLKPLPAIDHVTQKRKLEQILGLCNNDIHDSR